MVKQGPGGSTHVPGLTELAVGSHEEVIEACAPGDYTEYVL